MRWHPVKSHDPLTEVRVGWTKDTGYVVAFLAPGASTPDRVLGGDGELVTIVDVVTATWGSVDWLASRSALVDIRDEPIRAELDELDDPRAELMDVLRLALPA